MDKVRRMDDTKMLWHMDRVVAHFEKGERVAPIHIDMGATKACNVKCMYCYGQYQNMDKSRIHPDVLIKLFHDAPLVGIRSIGLVGDGEPTLNPGIWEAVKIGKKNGLDIAVSTNGLLMHNDYKIETLLENCTWLRFNLSAGTREGYHKIHGVDKFDNLKKIVARTMELKRQHGYSCDVGFQTVFVPKLMNSEVIEEARLAVELGIDYMLIKQCSLPEGNQSVNEVSFTVEDMDHLDTIAALKTCESLATSQTDVVVKWSAMQQQRNMIVNNRRPYEGCLGIPFLLQISGNGKVFPCGHLFGKSGDAFLMGDLHENSIGDIIRSDRYWDIVERMKTFDVHNGCHGACRQDKVNEFCYIYSNKPKGINFI